MHERRREYSGGVFSTLRPCLIRSSWAVARAASAAPRRCLSPATRSPQPHWGSANCTERETERHFRLIRQLHRTPAAPFKTLFFPTDLTDPIVGRTRCGLSSDGDLTPSYIVYFHGFRRAVEGAAGSKTYVRNLASESFEAYLRCGL